MTDLALPLLDVIGAVCAIKIGTKWLRAKGPKFWEWTGVASHALKCPFCSGFWLCLGYLLATGGNPVHAFAGGALVYAFWQTFGDESVSVPVMPVIETRPESFTSPTIEPAFQDYDELDRERQKLIYEYRKKYPRGAVAGSFIEDEAENAFVGEELLKRGVKSGT